MVLGYEFERRAGPRERPEFGLKTPAAHAGRLAGNKKTHP